MLCGEGNRLAACHPAVYSLQPEGWPMTRQQYEKLVQLVRPDAER